jgi:hypothetical protein
MDNRFHTLQLLKSFSTYSVSKGDLPGHAFHGNQHEKAQSDLMFGKNRISTALNNHRYLQDGDHMFDAYHALREGHLAMAKLHEAEAEKSSGEVYRSHRMAQAAHERAASHALEGLTHADDGEDSYGTKDEDAVRAEMKARADRQSAATEEANSLSVIADQMSGDAQY